jgi:hypothetical protein
MNVPKYKVLGKASTGRCRPAETDVGGRPLIEPPAAPPVRPIYPLADVNSDSGCPIDRLPSIKAPLSSDRSWEI